MKRAKPCCPTCGRTILQVKSTPAETYLSRFFREAYTCMAWGAPWPWVPGSQRCEPAVMRAGVTSEPETGAWEQTSITVFARPLPPLESSACTTAHPCALHRGKLNSMDFTLSSQERRAA